MLHIKICNSVVYVTWRQSYIL